MNRQEAAALLQQGLMVDEAIPPLTAATVSSEILSEA